MSWRDAEERADRDEIGRDPSRQSSGYILAIGLLVFVLAALLGLVFGAFDHVSAAESRHRASPTAEQVDYCREGLEALCVPSEPVSVDLDWRRRRELEIIHEGFRRDAQRGWFDCDGYVQHVVEALLLAGWPRGSLIWASGWTAEGVHHAWLSVRTSEGEFALDPLRKDITPARDVIEYSQVKVCEFVGECWRR
jgi:hypothetical protein